MRIEVALYYFTTFQVYYYHVFGLHLVVAYARRLDDDETFLAVDT